MNDVDETLPGPFEWDVRRLAASLAVAGRQNSESDPICAHGPCIVAGDIDALADTLTCVASQDRKADQGPPREGPDGDRGLQTQPAHAGSTNNAPAAPRDWLSCDHHA